MTGTLTLHLGDFRTGTTAIQRWLREHGAAHGIFYPPGFNHAPLAQSLGDAAGRAHHFARMATELAAHDQPHSVISAEHFELADPTHLAAALDQHMGPLTRGLRLIAYVRPHPSAYLARFAESTKIGSYTGLLDGYLDWPQTIPRMSYAARFTRWKAVFGDSLTVRLFDPAGFVGGDIVRDFASFVTGQDPGPNATPGPINPSLGIEALSTARALHAAIGPLPPAAQGARFTLGRHLGRQLEVQGGASTPLALHRALAHRLAEAFGADAARADATLFDGTPLTTALQAAPDQALAEAQSLDPADHLNGQARHMITLWGAMLRHGLTAPDGAASLDRLYHE